MYKTVVAFGFDDFSWFEIPYLHSGDQERIQAALCFANEMHAFQYYGLKPYIYHIFRVVTRLVKDYQPAYILIAGALHDICEDVDYDVEDIIDNFGEDIADIVSLLTRLPSESYSEYIKLIVDAAAADDYYAPVIIKQADLLENIHATTRMVDDARPYYRLLPRWMKAYVTLSEV